VSCKTLHFSTFTHNHPFPARAEEHDAQFPAEVMGCISESVCGMLSDYHALVTDPRVMKVRLLGGAGWCKERVRELGRDVLRLSRLSGRPMPVLFSDVRWVGADSRGRG
jgi:hypothetical protein